MAMSVAVRVDCPTSMKKERHSSDGARCVPHTTRSRSLLKKCVVQAAHAELHGRMRHFPTLLRLRPVPDLIPTYEVAELLNLGSLVVQDCQIELAQARGIGDRLDLGDLAVPNREIEDEEQVPTRCHDECHGSVYESRSEALSTS